MVSIVALWISRGFRGHSSHEQRGQECKGECSFHRILLTGASVETATHSSGFRFVVTYSSRGKTGYRVCANTFLDWNEEDEVTRLVLPLSRKRCSTRMAE